MTLDEALQRIGQLEGSLERALEESRDFEDDLGIKHRHCDQLERDNNELDELVSELKSENERLRKLIVSVTRIDTLRYQIKLPEPAELLPLGMNWDVEASIMSPSEFVVACSGFLNGDGAQNNGGVI